jgi:hypothetical protein
VANTPKQNFRCDGDAWTRATDKAERMRQAGYPINMTRLLVAEVEKFGTETIEQTAQRLGLERAA